MVKRYNKSKGGYKIFDLGLEEGTDRLYALHQYHQGDVLGVVPPLFQDIATSDLPVAKASYIAKKQGNISIHLLKTQNIYQHPVAEKSTIIPLLPDISFAAEAAQAELFNKKGKPVDNDKIARRLAGYRSFRLPGAVPSKYSIQATFSVNDTIARKMQHAIAQDVVVFANGIEPKRATSSSFDYGSINPVAKIQTIPVQPNVLLASGKGKY